MAESATEQPAPVLKTDIFCRICGYNLRGLSPEARCPECGQDIRLSLSRDPLENADPRWRRKIALGTLLFIVLHYQEIARGGPFGYADSALFAWISSGTAIAICVGGWLVTSREPNSKLSAWQQLSLVLLRASVLFWAIFWLFFAFQPWMLKFAIGPLEFVPPIGPIPIVFLAFDRLRQLASRSEEHSLARLLRIASWLLPLTAIAIILAAYASNWFYFALRLTSILEILFGCMLIGGVWQLYRPR